MTQRRCCCGNADTVATTCPESLPTPGPGCSAAKWRVSCATTGMVGLQYGSGQVTGSDGGCLDCMNGSCTLVARHQGSVDFADPYAEGECWTPELQAEACAKYAAGKALVPTQDGHHVLEFTGGSYSVMDGSNVTYDDQYDCVYIQYVFNCVPFHGCSDSTQTGLFSEVRVEFLFDVTYNAWSLNPSGGGECAWTQYPVHVQQSWTCTYQRLLMSSQYLAEGAYKLVKVVAPIAGWVYGGGCTNTPCNPVFFPLEYCAPNYWSGVDYQGVSLPWHPPATVTVNRIC